MSSGWFDTTTPLLCTSLEGNQGVQCYGLCSTHSNLFKQVHRLSKQQLAWSECSSTHSNFSEPVQSLSKQQKEQAARSSPPSNLSKLLHSLSKQQLAWSARGSTHSSSNYCTGVLCESSVWFDSFEPLQT